MKRTLALTVTGLVMVALLAGLAIAEVIRPSAWQEELEAYIEHARRTLGEVVTPLSLARARHPARFDARLSRARGSALSTCARLRPAASAVRPRPDHAWSDPS